MKQVFETKRLKFLPFHAGHLDRLYQLFCRNEKVMQHALKGRTLTLTAFIHLLRDDFIRSPNDGYGFLCVEERGSGDFVGITGLLKCDFLGENDLEFGFILEDRFWGKGLATEIGRFWLDHAARELKLKRVLATTSPQNAVSQRVLEKLGMNVVKEIEVEGRGKRIMYMREFGSPSPPTPLPF